MEQKSPMNDFLSSWIPRAVFAVISEHICFLLLVFSLCFYTFQLSVPCGRLSWLMLAFERTLKQHLVSYRIVDRIGTVQPKNVRIFPTGIIWGHSHSHLPFTFPSWSLILNPVWFPRDSPAFPSRIPFSWSSLANSVVCKSGKRKASKPKFTEAHRCQRPETPQHNSFKLLCCGFSGRRHLWATVWMR